MYKSGTDGQKVIDLTHNEVHLAQDDKESAQSNTKNNRENNDWVGEDITVITETRQQAHIHQSGKVAMYSYSEETCKAQQL